MRPVEKALIPEAIQAHTEWLDGYVNERVALEIAAERERIAVKMLNPQNPFDWDLDPQALREWLANP